MRLRFPLLLPSDLRGASRFAIVVAACLCVGPAAAFVREMTTGNSKSAAPPRPLRWTQSCVPLTPDVHPPPGLTLADVSQVLDNATQNWNQPTEQCSSLSLLPRAAGTWRAGADGINALFFLAETWGRGATLYDPDAAALTSVSYRSHAGMPDDGVITDADIEMNAVNFQFARVDPDHPDATPIPEDGRDLADLENTLTHELGHVLGLAHTCWDGNGTQPLDSDGLPVIACSSLKGLPPAVLTSTMFPYAASRETSKRFLSSDDGKAICRAYPQDAGPDAGLLACQERVFSGCMTSGGGPGRSNGGWASWLALVLILALVKSRRNRD